MGEIKLTDVKKSFGALAVLKDIDLHIKDGEFVVFVGPSGCGKSTLLRTIAGLEKVTGGEIQIDGKRVNEVTAADRGLAMVFQSYALYPHMSVRQNLAFGLENSSMPKAEITERIIEAARMLEIEAYMDRRPGQLSGGQRQRVAIGRAIVRRPTAFLLDEPLSNLDAELRVSTRAELAALHARLGSTMIYVTHDQVEAMTLAHRIVVMRAGKIEQVGTPLELYNEPANRFVAGFIGAPHMNFLKADVLAVSAGSATLSFAGGHRAELKIGHAKLHVGDKVTVGVRPQHLVVSNDPQHPTAKLYLVEALGSETVVHGEIGGEKLLAVLPGQQKLNAGDTVHFDLSKPVLHVFDDNGHRLFTHPGSSE
ncbi:sn-glycerol-3-phosphate ABC transporter ATP-binding protein UgpC [Rhizobium wenxiniae]|uniref:ABC transporter ATP-binding protein n=1 Tax=Rhizobium wenxiniae TaxID=1737357 RepID=UPI001C6DEB2B|nr:sn-glycerol-3-phosphate ABC transporter ATP-binding protein UgpC [Rhizobium wenxiniae]MBW9089609.1 sn-glycerol-3-phosphate ABC transporter ATP-binding protein UgpC [Rhizobium wenxiniae]